MAPAISLATGGLASADAGVTSAAVNTMQQIGGSVGTALLNTLAADALASYSTAYWWSAGFFAAGAVITVLLYRRTVRRQETLEDTRTTAEAEPHTGAELTGVREETGEVGTAGQGAEDSAPQQSRALAQALDESTTSGAPDGMGACPRGHAADTPGTAAALREAVPRHGRRSGGDGGPLTDAEADARAWLQDHTETAGERGTTGPT